MVYVVYIVEMFLKDSAMESWQFKTGIQIHPEVICKVKLLFVYCSVFHREEAAWYPALDVYMRH